MKKIFFTLFILGSFLMPAFGWAGAETVPAKLPVVYLYHGAECPHCQAEIRFLDNLQKELPGLEVKKFEVWHNADNAILMQEAANKLGANVQGVPFTVIGDKYIVGFDNDNGIGKQIRGMILSSGSSQQPENQNQKTLPILGRVDLKEASLPLLTAAIGILDGFNPCSMWALLTMITIILATGDRKKLWVVGWTFIIVSAASYFLFMVAWLNALQLLSVIKIVRYVVGLVAIGSGIGSLVEFFTRKPNVCEVGSIDKQQKIVDRFKKIIQSPSIAVIILGVAGVAFSVNLVELMCSLGFPVVYTQALVLHNISALGKYIYIVFYVFFYMLENIIILLIAGFSMKFFIIDSKFTKYSRLVGGLAMLILGILFIFKPDLLRF